MKKIKAGTVIEYILVGISGILFILVASSWTSPLFPWAYGYDSSWYSLMGRAILEGKVPYKDLFDLKGPLLFFYEALGQFFIKGRNGIFLIQCISIVFTSVFLYKLSRLYLKRISSAFILMLFYFTEFSILWGGNTAEELFMPFNMAAVYFTVNYLRNKRYDECEIPSFALGLGFAIMTLSKITIATALVSSIITVVIHLFLKKEWKNVVRSAGYFLTGSLIVVLPVLFYFGFRDALSDFFFAVFTFAFKRSTDYYEAFSLDWEKSLLIADAAFIFGLLLKGDTEEKKTHRSLIIVTSIITYLLLHLGTPYPYYFLSLMPLFGLFSVLWLKNIREFTGKVREKDITAGHIAVNIIMTLLIIPAVGFWIVPSVNKIEENINIFKYDIGREQVEDCVEINELIPEWERNEVYNLESGMIYYEVNQLLPSNKYPVNLPYFLHLNPPIKEEVLRKLRTDRPAWIICEYMEGFDDEDIQKYVFDNYELIADNTGEQLYRRCKP